ncbi:MAG: hypothetical protein IT379_04135 [Deltaproteobacteria bacterium]|nr:hypothetical protein [Deltaproteobacteria bacterium]
MTADADLLAKLPAAARDAFARALAAASDAERSAYTAKAWDAVGIPAGEPGFPVHALPSDFDDVQRAALEYAAHHGLGAYPYACPAAPATLRAWLGLEPGVLETEHVGGEPLWRALQIAREVAKQAAILDALPCDVALRALDALYTTGFGYRINTSLLLPHGQLRVLRDLRDEGRAWALARADAMADVPSYGSALRAFVFLALVRAKVPIEPRWDWMYPSLPGAPKDLLFECARAIPEERRAAVVGPHLRSIPWAVEMVAELPTAPMARALLAAEEPSSPRWVHFVEQLRALGATHPAIAAEVDAAVAAAPRPIELRVTRVVRPEKASELTPLEREQLRIGARGMDEQDVDADARLADDGSETSVRGTLEIRTLADAGGTAVYDTLMYAADCGVIFRAGTTEEIGWRVQGGIVLAERNDALRNALQIAVDAKARATPRGPKTRKAPKATRRRTS